MLEKASTVECVGEEPGLAFTGSDFERLAEGTLGVFAMSIPSIR